jgi:hypothetical protein
VPTDVQSQQGFATRLAIEWSAERQRRADGAGIQVSRIDPAPRTYWKEEWGDGDIFRGFPDDPAEVKLELTAESEHHAAATIMRELEVGPEDFIVWPTWCPAAGR